MSGGEGDGVGGTMISSEDGKSNGSGEDCFRVFLLLPVLVLVLFLFVVGVVWLVAGVARVGVGVGFFAMADEPPVLLRLTRFEALMRERKREREKCGYMYDGIDMSPNGTVCPFSLFLFL